MAIGIVGNYGNDNQGDDAILEGIIIQLEDTYQIQRKDILVFSNNPAQTRDKYGVQAVNLFQRRKTDVMKVLATIKHHRPLMKQLDLLIIGGGGILMDLYRSAPILYAMYSWLARWTKTPSVIYGVGAGPIQSKMGEMLLKSIVNNAAMVTVRDPISQQLLQSIGAKGKIDVIADPALFIRPPKGEAMPRGDFHIGVTAAPYYHKSYWPVEDQQKYTQYIQGMAKGLDKILREDDRVTINFFSTKHPYDTNVTKDIQQLMTERERTTVRDEMLTHDEVLDVIQNQDLIIGTRLHSLILAVVTETPIIAISYHHKVQDFMDLIGCSKDVIPIDDLYHKSDFLLHSYQQMNSDWELTCDKAVGVLQQLKGQTPSGMDLLTHIYPTTMVK